MEQLTGQLFVTEQGMCFRSSATALVSHSEILFNEGNCVIEYTTKLTYFHDLAQLLTQIKPSRIRKKTFLFQATYSSVQEQNMIIAHIF